MTSTEKAKPSVDGGKLWGVDLKLTTGLTVEVLKPDLATERLELGNMGVEESIKRGIWLVINGGDCVVHIPDPDKFWRAHSKGGLALSATDPLTSRQDGDPPRLLLSDLDDTLITTSAWHEREFQLMAEFCLSQTGIEVGLDWVRRLYEMSKILVKPDQIQRRYTPRLNLGLVTELIQLLNGGMEIETAIQALEMKTGNVESEVINQGKICVQEYEYDEELLRHLLINNPIQSFLVTPLVEDLFTPDPTTDPTGTQTPDGNIRIIITRGMIQGPLGQVHKIHQSGLMELPGVDMVIYTNDIKMETLLLLNKVFEGSLDIFKNRPMILYDDNPGEIMPFYRQAGGYERGLEIVRVRVNRSKRRDHQVEATTYNEGVGVVNPLVQVGYRFSDGKSVATDNFDGVGRGEMVVIYEHFVPSEVSIGMVV